MKFAPVLFGCSLLLYLFHTCNLAYSMEQNVNFTDSNKSMTEQNDKIMISFTEMFVSHRARRNINITKLMMEYSMICPISYSCGVNFDERFLLDLDFDLKTINEDCSRCSCDYECVERNNCCPGSHYGYIAHECVNTMLYPRDEMSFCNMVSKCNMKYDWNETTIEMCETETHPCSGKISKLTYKNQHCAMCNAEAKCIPWKTDIKCAEDFQQKISLFTSMTEALNASKCHVQFTADEFVCSVKGDGYDDLVNKCNVTGLWTAYDEDIEWACENFVNPYKGFQSVYCYICNPSIAIIQTVELIEECPSATDDQSQSVLLNACKTFPISTRLAPYKNIYCLYVCNKDYRMLKNTTDSWKLQNISEKYDNTLHSQLSLEIQFSRRTDFEEMKRFVKELLNDLSIELVQNSTSLTLTKVDITHEDVSSLVDDYINVCGHPTVCSRIENNTISYSNPVCGKCSCYADCVEYETCCPDVLMEKQPYSCINSILFPKFYNIGTHHVTGFQDILNTNYTVIDVCLNNETDAELSYNCSLYQATTDYIRDIPVSTLKGNIYRNIYCFICNSNEVEAVLKFQVFCDIYIEYALFTNFKTLLDFIQMHCNKVSFVPIQSKPCVESYNLTLAQSVLGKKYLRMKTRPGQLSSIQYVFVDEEDLYKPVKRVFTSCNETGKLFSTNTAIEHACKSNALNILALPEYRLENNVYKNFACFMCNPEATYLNISDFNMTSECPLNSSIERNVSNWKLEKLCNEATTYSRWLPYKNMYCSECNLPPLHQVEVQAIINSKTKQVQMYKYIFSISRSDFESLARASDQNYKTSCSTGIYDHNRAKCWLLHCNGGFQLVNRTCKPMLESATRHLYSIRYFLKYQRDNQNNNVTDTYDTDALKPPLIVDLADICARLSDNITGTLDTTTNYYIQSRQCITSCLPKKQISNTMRGSMFFEMLETTVIEVNFIVGIVYTKSLSTVHASLIKALNQIFEIRNISDINGTVRSFNLYSYSKEYGFFRSKINGDLCMSLHSSPVKLDQASINSHYTVDKYLTCPHVRINVSQTIINDSTADLYYLKENVTFKKDNYKIQGMFAVICISDLSKYLLLENRIAKRTTHFSIDKLITFSCTVVSLACLIITFITYCLFSTLRTVPGKNIMTLCFFLFCSQCFLLFGLQLENGTNLCIVIGMCNHFCWLASFCTMNTCSFHMFKLFFLSSFTGNIGSYNQHHNVYLKYLCYVIFLPLIIVVTTISINLTIHDDLGYGRFYCFISDFDVFIGSFFIPACLIFSMNIIFFSFAFHTIRTTTYVQSTHSRHNFFVCLRLCTFVGITWPLIILENVLNLSWFSFLVSGLNALQGCFIFLSFVVNKRVLSLFCPTLRNKYRTHSINTVRTGTTLSH